MYERSAIVLERYFEKLFGFTKEHNLKENYKNFTNLIEETKEYIDIVEQEENIIKEFDDVANTIGTIQKKQDRIYKENLKLEEIRNDLFNEISEKPEVLEQKMIKVESSLNQNNEKIENLREEYIGNLATFVERQEERNIYDRNKRKIEARHIQTLKETIEKFNRIAVEEVERLHNFVSSDSQKYIEELNEIMTKNGKQERIAIDEKIIRKSIETRMEIAKKEAELYINIYDKTKRLLTVLESGNLKLGRSEKVVRDTGVKLAFLALKKEYIFSFLDYERMTIINGEEEHKNLMEEACENFDSDIKQINNLYELLERETISKATKKAYNELYNVDYLQHIENKERNFENKLQNSKIQKSSVINSNFWRIEGIKNMYYLFQKEVTEKFDRDLSEYSLEDEENFILPMIKEEIEYKTDFDYEDEEDYEDEDYEEEEYDEDKDYYEEEDYDNEDDEDHDEEDYYDEDYEEDDYDDEDDEDYEEEDYDDEDDEDYDEEDYDDEDEEDYEEEDYDDEDDEDYDEEEDYDDEDDEDYEEDEDKLVIERNKKKKNKSTSNNRRRKDDDMNKGLLNRLFKK